MNEVECQAHSFAELVRQQAHRIATLAMAGKNDQASEMALKLCTLAAARKRELEDKEDTA